MSFFAPELTLIDNSSYEFLKIAPPKRCYRLVTSLLFLPNLLTSPKQFLKHLILAWSRHR